MRHVHKIRSPRRWSHVECFTRDLGILACSLAPPLQIPTKLSLLRRLVLTGQRFTMEITLVSSTRCELRAVICFLSAKSTTPIDIRQLCKVYGPQCMDIKNMWKWVREFMYRLTDIHDEQHSGRPKQLQKWSKKCLKVGLWQFASCAHGSLMSVRVRLTRFWPNICFIARWVPKMLTEDHKQ